VTNLVVYIDDDEDLCEAFEIQLEDSAFEVKTFSDQSNARKFIEENLNNIKVVFVDYKMPEANGDEFALTLPDSLPKYLVTGNIGQDMDDIFSGIIVKPYEHDEICEIVKKHSA
jgi:DNA-binding NtrC family response regulator